MKMMMKIIEYDSSNFLDLWNDDIRIFMWGLKWIICNNFIVIMKIVIVSIRFFV